MHLRRAGVLLLLLIAGCSSQISGMSLDSTDFQEKEVVDKQGKLKNIQYLDDFVKSVEQGEEAEVRVTKYTVEGDQVFTRLSYEEDVINYEHDTTKDEFGTKKVTEKTCESISREERTIETVYALACGSTEIDVLTISYDAGEQDRFDIQFVYDKENRVKLDTIERSLSLQAESASMKENNFHLTKEERNSLYKLLIMGNFSGDKDVTNECRDQPEYSLRVLINGNEKQYQWSSCDSGEDVEEMTEMAERMAAVIKETKQYKQFFQ
ncbi:DUF4362 domain-containing protein [Halobacillus sp. Marseille-Q1614]|uniref:DUF4362 domain-containing protein n=1 Tax=Halobacillus sp. Marseille-Q1614 TaxID=2709134 RepID=UPI00156E8C3F|nr:DUF4362 domain-containing protein [Halobacillus sp. Marseille-Q1614]